MFALQAGVRLPSSDGKTSTDLHGVQHGAFIELQTVKSRGAKPSIVKLPANSLFVERYALVLHLWAEAERLHSDR